MAGHVDVNVPSLDFAESLDPAADVFRLLARPEVREVAVLKQAAEKGDLGGRQADRGLCGRESGFQADQLDFLRARCISGVVVLLVTVEAEDRLSLEGLVRQGRVETPHTRLQAPVPFQAARQIELIPAQPGLRARRCDDGGLLVDEDLVAQRVVAFGVRVDHVFHGLVGAPPDLVQ